MLAFFLVKTSLCVVACGHLIGICRPKPCRALLAVALAFGDLQQLKERCRLMVELLVEACKVVCVVVFFLSVRCSPALSSIVLPHFRASCVKIFRWLSSLLISITSLIVMSMCSLILTNVC